MNGSEFLSAVRRRWRLFVAVVVACAAIGVGCALVVPAGYVSTVQLLVAIDGTTTASAYENDQVVSGRVNSYVALLTSEAVAQRVVDELGLTTSARELAGDVNATIVPPRTAVIDVAVTGESPDQARLLADTVAREFITYTDALESPTGTDDQKIRTSIVTTASVPRAGLPRPLTFGVLGALVGLVLGSVAVWLRSSTDPVIRTSERAAAATGLPVIGSVTHADPAGGEDLEGYRRLRTRLRALAGGAGEPAERARVWVLTCAAGESGGAAVAPNLGRALAVRGGRVIVVDANPAGPAIADESDPGLLQVLAGSATADQAIRCHLDGLPDVLPVGSCADDPGDLMAAAGMRRLVHRLRLEYSHVVIAAPPVLPTVGASVVSEYADGVLLVVVPGTTRRRELTRAVERLGTTDAPVIGTVMCVEPSGPAVPERAAVPRSGSAVDVESDELPPVAR
ncbi:Wzz/FepE/Etk N-terminal domain-containing protein [Rhodococcus daqingensis]|uniref:Wzz/FepE/Etk N-terminal domain-containing protein n=1 Tax=Rhodococcus daqingensis TaxID=2479363 RepID=A0ABW2RY56_9NOCA